jgi:hypothetical protein
MKGTRLLSWRILEKALFRDTRPARASGCPPPEAEELAQAAAGSDRACAPAQMIGRSACVELLMPREARGASRHDPAEFPGQTLLCAVKFFMIEDFDHVAAQPLGMGE